MPTVRTPLRSFAGGELTPEFWSHFDDAKFQSGLALCRNFRTLPHGPAENRPGTQYVAGVVDSTRRTRVIPFVYSTTQSFALQVAHKAIRLHTLGATLLARTASAVPAAYNGATAYTPGDVITNGGVDYYCTANTTGNAPPNTLFWYALPTTAYEIPTPYDEADLFDLHYVQSQDVLTLVHPNYPPMELRRIGALKWQLTTISFASKLIAPSLGLTAVAHTGTTPGATSTCDYVVTSVSADLLDESLPSSNATCLNNLFDTGAYNTISWTAVAGAAGYKVYRKSNGLYGYIGRVTGATSMIDDGGGNVVTPDISQTPPMVQTTFSASGDYPGAVTYFEQRRAFGGSINAPQNLWMTKSGTESNMNFGVPSHDTDSITVRVAAREANTIRHMVPINSLMLLTSSAEWRTTSVNSDAITPSSISVKPQSFIGANNVQPAIINNNVVFASARGGHMREMAYNWQAQGFLTGDLSLRAPHLFDGFEVVDMAYAKSPYPIVWAVSSTGYLLGLTYVPEQQIGGWHWHDTTLGIFESVCVVPEGSEDAVYAVLQRTINGQSVRYIERFASRLFHDPADAFFVDCGATYNGLPTTVISGLTWLEGCTVSILADAAVQAQKVVRSGQITLDTAASIVQVGLPITSDLQTLPCNFNESAYGQGRQKNVDAVWLRVKRSSGFSAGPTFDSLAPYPQRTTEPLGSPPALLTDEVRLVVPARWQYGGQVCIRQADPLPLTITGATLEVAVGG